MELSLRGLLLTSLFVAQAACNAAHRAELLSYAAAAADGGNAPPHYNVQMFPDAYKIVNLTAQYFPEHDSKRVEMKYGPFPVQSMATNNGMVDYVQVGAQMPCTNCTITWVQASLEYPNGSYANANTSLWLHHTVLFNLRHQDTVCGSNWYAKGQRWFASGNERTAADICRNGTVPTGYNIGPDSPVMLLVELMNQGMDEQQAVLTITYEYIQGFPDGFYEAIPIWLDIGGCTIASDMPCKSNTTFEYTSPPYKANFSGAIIGMGGHLHDGGTHLEIFKNNDEVCNCISYYGQTPGYWDAPGTSMIMPMDPVFSPMEHISSITGCLAPTAVFNVGDELKNTAYYNLTEYVPMLNVDGTLADIMGISLVYAAKDMTEDEMHKYAGTKVEPLAITPEPTSVAYMDMQMVPGMPDMGRMAMTCIPRRDSPGTISTAGIDMSDRHIAMDYLMAILNDACLQAWSNKYARDFWYGIVTVIGIFTIVRLLTWAKLHLRKNSAAANKPLDTLKMLWTPVSGITNAVRAVSYPQMVPVREVSFLRIPNSSSILMVLSYFGFLMALEFINVSTGDDQTYQSMGVRAAWLTVAQVPLIVLLANKKNFIELFTAVSYERLNVLHRWVARGLLMTASMHFGFQSYGWARAGVMQLEWNTDTCPPTGIAAYAIVLWMNLSTLAPIRHLCYEFFVIQHILTFFGLIIAIMFHIPKTALYARTYIWSAIALYLASRIVQTALYAYHNISPGQASMTIVSEGVTKITVKNGKFNSWRPGSFVLLSIPRYGIFQSHPASIASTPISNGGDLVFFLRKHKGFTKRISKDSAPAQARVALLDGPYGGRQSDFAAFQSAVLVAGSTGITFALPIFLDIAARASRTRLPIQELNFIWATKDQAFIKSLEGTILNAMAQLRDAGINVTAQIYITGAYDLEVYEHDASETSSNSEQSPNKASEKQDAVQTRITATRSDSSSSDLHKSALVRAGRPELGSVLVDARAASAGEMGVAVCGPQGLSAEVRNTVSRMQFSRGGVYLHVEGFSW